MSVLKIKDENGNWIGVTTIKGEKGEPGGFVEHAEAHSSGGTDPITPESIGAATSEEVASHEAQLSALFSDNTFFWNHLENKNNPHGVTAEQVGATTYTEGALLREDLTLVENRIALMQSELTHCAKWVTLADVVGGPLAIDEEFEIPLSDDLLNYNEYMLICCGTSGPHWGYVYIYTGASEGGDRLGSWDTGGLSSGNRRQESCMKFQIIKIPGGPTLNVNFAGNSSGRLLGLILSSTTIKSLYIRNGSSSAEQSDARYIVLAR